MSVANGTSTTNGHVSSRAAKYNLPSHFIGGNHLEVAAPSNVKDFVDQHDGHSVISSVGRPDFAHDRLCALERAKLLIFGPQ